MTVTTSSNNQRLTIPTGSVWVSTRQANAALAYSILEPEDIASVVSYARVYIMEKDEYSFLTVLEND